MSVPITPETRVATLLEAYPGLEETLLAAAPAFSRLRNPVLRATVARTVTLEQAARIGGISARELVQRLRRAAGVDAAPAPDPEPPPEASGAPPEWLDAARVRVEIDADAMLAMGEHPVGKVRQSIANLQGGEIVRLTSSFAPVPLIDAMRRAGTRVHSAETEPGRWATWFCRP